VSASYRGQCRPGTGAASGKCQAGAGATVSTMNRVRTTALHEIPRAIADNPRPNGLGEGSCTPSELHKRRVGGPFAPLRTHIDLR
jgi:hypothetical protein